MLTRYGYHTLIIIATICVLIIAASFIFNDNLIRFFIILLSLFFLGLSVNFFRDPERQIPKQNNVIVSPADGKVILVKKLINHKYVSGTSKQISIFMSPLDVHVNRIPICGKVKFIEYHKGKFFQAFTDKAAEENERTEFGIETKFGKVFFTQVAGAIARRIIYEIKENDDVVIGERFGMIKFGSRVDIIVPENWHEKVQVGSKTTAGETILFEHTT